jgi:Flp pilus assembly pilin Flp
VRRRPDEKGASALEYALMVAAIAGVLVAVVVSLGSVLQGSLENTSACFSKQLDSKSC